ncbi:helix-turn-helix transcriptional regulator [Streptomyces sp. NPDC005485]|uniref:helix-turn-helix domain-containing protein n=1 Tax=Streptomyces sp. NPDC005485 TaxID=3155591 RepID=UPI0033A946C8
MARGPHNKGSGASGDVDSGLGAYLRARRAQVTPEQVGLSATGLRRTPGLRREELAALAGVSIDYYTRLERGRECRPSPAVLDALARALQLDTYGRQHLHDLAVRAARAVRAAPQAQGAPAAREIRRSVLLLVEELRPNPVFVLGRTLDVLACNPSALGLFAGLDAQPASDRNIARYVFLHPDAPDVLDDWDEQARACVARLRVLAGTDPDARDLTALVDALLAKSPDFADLWSRYDVKPHVQGIKTFHHPDVGDLSLCIESMPLDETLAHRFVAFCAEPGTADHDKMVRLDIGTAESAACDRADHITA